VDAARAARPAPFVAVRFEHRATLPAPRSAVYALLMDVPRVARLVPGVSDVASAGDGGYRGVLNVRLGPMRFAFRGDVAIIGREPDRAATMRAEGREASGGVRAMLTMSLADADAGTELRIASDVQVIGRLGELGQPIIKRKADELMREFATNLERELAR
jgi:carbon monoxide dehydrogenase subunit G